MSDVKTMGLSVLLAASIVSPPAVAMGRSLVSDTAFEVRTLSMGGPEVINLNRPLHLEPVRELSEADFETLTAADISMMRAALSAHPDELDYSAFYTSDA
ncbi:hypothetical protein QE370_000473 [Aeromicrobium sp. SORGH_AS981]|uniref:hypothetical protein n=1 Tax=Aeromicrobium sp. SORGH_AS_0981 TaxID=3041802 RepID=UPI002854EC0F|nr:hypothetical protein [Aeromicrobium sp. SORGH_AS_0981]MDR6117289.1 hypothetical protein [Aeromicrobium sp. SORGH_AS_0981]